MNWIFTPDTAAADFGFILKDLADNAQNALLRDFTSFFVATLIFALLGVVTLNPTWFFSAGIIIYVQQFLILLQCLYMELNII